MRFRSGVIGTTSSWRSEAICGSPKVTLSRPGVTGAALWRSTSSLSRRPPGPVGATSLAARPCSARAWRAAGMTRDSAPAGAVAGAFSASATGVGAAGVSVPKASASTASIVPMTSPTSAVSPAFLKISRMTPLAGAGSSAVTLSVSRTTTGSSCATRSPGLLSQSPRMTSEIDSPKEGITSSIAMEHLSPVARRGGRRRGSSRRRRSS